MNKSAKVGGAFVVTCIGCALAAPVLFERGGVPSDLATIGTWQAYAGFATAFLGAVTAILSLVKSGPEPLTGPETRKAVKSELTNAGLATKADIDEAVEKLLIAREPSEAGVVLPLDQLRTALESLANSHVSAKTEAFRHIEEGRVEEGLKVLETFAQHQLGLVGAAAEQTADTWKQLGLLLMVVNTEKSVSALEEAAKLAPNDFETQAHLCNLYPQVGRVAEARIIGEKLIGLASTDQDRAIALSCHAEALLLEGKLAQSLELHSQAANLFRKILRGDAKDLNGRRGLAISLENMAIINGRQGKPDAALRHLEESLANGRSIADEYDSDIFKHDIAVTLGRMGNTYLDQGKHAQGLSLLEDSLSTFRELVSRNSTNQQYLTNLSTCLEDIAQILIKSKEYEKALVAMNESAEIAQGLHESDPSNTGHARYFAVTLGRLGYLHRYAGNTEESLLYHTKGAEMLRQMIAGDPANADLRRDLALTLGGIGDALTDQKKWAEARTVQEECLALARGNSERDPSNAQCLRDVTLALEKLGNTFENLGDSATALKLYEESLPIVVHLTQIDSSHEQHTQDLLITQRRITELKAKLA